MAVYLYHQVAVLQAGRLGGRTAENLYRQETLAGAPEHQPGAGPGPHRIIAHHPAPGGYHRGAGVQQGQLFFPAVKGLLHRGRLGRGIAVPEEYLRKFFWVRFVAGAARRQDQCCQ